MNLRQYLFDNRIQRNDFATSIGASPSMVSCLALGTRRPSVELAKNIEKVTKGRVLAAELLGLAEEKAPKYAALPKALHGAARRAAKRTLQAFADTAGVPSIVRGKAKKVAKK